MNILVQDFLWTRFSLEAGCYLPTIRRELLGNEVSIHLTLYMETDKFFSKVVKPFSVLTNNI